MREDLQTQSEQISTSDDTMAVFRGRPENVARDLALRMALNRLLGICLNHKKTYTSLVNDLKGAIQEMNSMFYKVRSG